MNKMNKMNRNDESVWEIVPTQNPYLDRETHYPTFKMIGNEKKVEEVQAMLSSKLIPTVAYTEGYFPELDLDPELLKKMEDLDELV